MRRRTIRYADELNDDFAGTHIRTKPLADDYRYMPRCPVWRAAAFLLYRAVAQPLIFLFLKLVYLQRFRNRSVLRAAKRCGAYVYANHTNRLLDAFVPNIVCARKRGYIVVGPDAMSIPGLRGVVEMLGAIPLGSTFSQRREMLDCVQTRIRGKGLVAIYPEAHIWPFYTKIRPFPPDAFVYPVLQRAPVYAMTNCYQKRRFGRFPKVVTYLDGPFFADPALSAGQQRKALRNACIAAMRARAAAHSNCAYIDYQKIPPVRPAQTERAGRQREAMKGEISK